MTKGKVFRLIAIGVIVTLLTVYIGLQLPFVQNRMYSKQNKKIATAALEINKNCPVMTDDMTRLDSASSLGDVTFAYHYTITKANAKHADTIYIREVMTPQIITNLKANKMMQGFNEIGCTVVVNYADSLGVHMLSIVVAPDTYKQ